MRSGTGECSHRSGAGFRAVLRDRSLAPVLPKCPVAGTLLLRQVMSMQWITKILEQPLKAGEIRMAKDTVMDEVLILKFFETGPIEKVEVVYNIVNAKMRERLCGRAEERDEVAERGPVRKRQVRTNAEPSREEAAPPPKV